MANYQYSSDIINDALFRAGEPTDGSSDFESVALSYLNRSYNALIFGGNEFFPTAHEDWWWLKAEANIILQPSITTGTVSVTHNSTSIAFSSGPASDMDGYFFKVDGHQDVFRISAHTAADTAATLDSVYTGTTNATASYRLFKLEYDLAAACLKVTGPMQAFRDSEYDIYGMALSELQSQYPLSLIQMGTPDRYAQVDEDTVRFNKYIDTDELVRVDYDYMRKPDALTDSGSEEPLVPLKFRYVLADMTTFFLLMDKDDTRAQAVGEMAKSGIAAMSLENRSRMANTGEMGQIKPRQSGIGRLRGPLRTNTGLIIG